MHASLPLAAEMPSPAWLRRFVDDIPTGIALFDRDLRYVAANSAWLKSLQLAPEKVIGRQHHELDRGNGAPFVELQRRALFGEVASGCCSAESDAGGHLFHRAISVKPWLGHEGGVLGIVAALQEIVTPPPEKAEHDVPDRLTGVAGRHH